MPDFFLVYVIFSLFFILITISISIISITISTKYQNEKSEKSGGIIRSTNLININQATKEQLTELSGIGPATAERIVDYRSKNGKFQSTEELLNVKGIGEKTLGKIKERLCI